MNQDNVQAVIQTLYAYAEAARRGHGSLDGKEIQRDTLIIADALESDAAYTAEELMGALEITKTNLGYEWKQYNA
ncbi:hypothetical protein ABRP63_11225 [Corynebacterium sp. KPL2623]|uniref:hypothetical protein n=1 Tax=Corynebacterium sp. KPL2623 TaxID=3158308 RepID=UPI0032EF244E